MLDDQVHWTVIAQSSAEIGAVCGVMAIALLLDVSSLEVARQKNADLDKEFRTNGIANLLASAVGGFAGSLSMNGCLLLDESGAVTRWSGVVVAVVCAIVLLSGVDIGSIVPKAILGGLLAYLGVAIFVELLQSPAQHSLTDNALAILMMLVIINFGHLMGVALGVVGACLLFALSYSRIGVIRRHLTSEEFSSNVQRSSQQSRILRTGGKRIHVFWLSGFIFFGSSNGLFERIKAAIDAQQDEPVSYVVLDFHAVPGLDSSAVLSFIKLRNYCNEHDVTLAFSDLTDAMRSSFRKAGFFGEGDPHRVSVSRNEALEWCEDMVLKHLETEEASASSFEEWLARELGGATDAKDIAHYFERHELQVGEALFEQGEPSDCVEILTSGCVTITRTDEQGRSIRLRSMVGQTVVGEMGFYRRVPRAANVVAEKVSVTYRLTPESFENMRAQHPAAATAFDALIIRLLSDRVEFADREISALV